jgi:hypothetical protein
MHGWARCSFHKNHASIRYAELVFLHLVGSVSHVVHSGASGPQNIDAPFFMLGWAHGGFHKKRIATCFAKLVFLHHVGSAGHVVNTGASRP